MLPWLFPLLLTAGLFVVTWGARRSQAFAWALLPIFGLPFVVPAVLGVVDVSWFTWAKVITLLVVLAAYNLFRFTRLGDTRTGAWMLWGLLALNIAEAVAKDWSDGFWVRGAVGLGLILTLGGTRAIGRQGLTRDIHWDLPLSWILTYSAWNLSFALRFYWEHTTDHVSHLGIPLLWVVLARGQWFQARGYALAVYALVIVAWIEGFRMPWPEPVFVAGPALYVPLTALSLALLTWHVGHRLGLTTDLLTPYRSSSDRRPHGLVQ